MASLKQHTMECWASLISDFQLNVTEFDANDLLLWSSGVCLWLFVDRDGLHVTALLEDVHGVWYEYPLGMLLVKRAGNEGSYSPSSGLDEEACGLVTSQLRWYGHSLKRFGRDILSDDRRWLQDYPWTAVPAAPQTAERVERLKRVE
jgi:hypothetical protein